MAYEVFRNDNMYSVGGFSNGELVTSIKNYKTEAGAIREMNRRNKAIQEA